MPTWMPTAPQLPSVTWWICRTSKSWPFAPKDWKLPTHWWERCLSKPHPTRSVCHTHQRLRLHRGKPQSKNPNLHGQGNNDLEQMEQTQSKLEQTLFASSALLGWNRTHHFKKLIEPTTHEPECRHFMKSRVHRNERKNENVCLFFVEMTRTVIKEQQDFAGRSWKHSLAWRSCWTLWLDTFAGHSNVMYVM